MDVGGQCHAPATLPQARDPVPIVEEAGWALGLVCTGVENFAPTIQPVASYYTNCTLKTVFKFIMAFVDASETVSNSNSKEPNALVFKVLLFCGVVMGHSVALGFDVYHCYQHLLTGLP
jgi:hypothetical protein